MRKKSLTRILSLLLVIAILFGTVPLTSFAKHLDEAEAALGDSALLNLKETDAELDGDIPSSANEVDIEIGEDSSSRLSVSLGLSMPALFATAKSDLFLLPIDPPAKGSIPISTAKQLDNIRNNKTADYHLTNDIDLSGYHWEPISLFSGVLDGQGYAVRNLTIDRLCANGKGLFGTLSGLVKNLAIENCNIDGQNNNEGVGSIAASVRRGQIINCYSTGMVSGSGRGVGGITGWLSSEKSVAYCYNTGKVIGDMEVGGIAGSLGDFGNISNCYNTGVVIGEASVGGIAGDLSHNSSVTDCYNSGMIHGNTETGGITGVMGHDSSIVNCYNTGTVGGNAEIGGIAGEVLHNSSIVNCYNTGAVGGNAKIGGIAGSTSHDSSVANCYSTGTVSGATNIGGIAGDMFNTSMVSSCLALSPSISGSNAGRIVSETSSNANLSHNYAYDGMLINKSSPKTDIGHHEMNGANITLTDAKKQSTYANLGWDFDTIWEMPENGGYPLLKGLSSDTPPGDNEEPLFKLYFGNPRALKNDYQIDRVLEYMYDSAGDAMRDIENEGLAIFLESLANGIDWILADLGISEDKYDKYCKDLALEVLIAYQQLDGISTSTTQAVDQFFVDASNELSKTNSSIKPIKNISELSGETLKIVTEYVLLKRFDQLSEATIRSITDEQTRKFTEALGLGGELSRGLEAAQATLATFQLFLLDYQLIEDLMQVTDKDSEIYRGLSLLQKDISKDPAMYFLETYGKDRVIEEIGKMIEIGLGISDTKALVEAAIDVVCWIYHDLLNNVSVGEIIEAEIMRGVVQSLQMQDNSYRHLFIVGSGNAEDIYKHQMAYNLHLAGLKVWLSKSKACTKDKHKIQQIDFWIDLLDNKISYELYLNACLGYKSSASERALIVNCPVDVFVYDDTDNLIASIVDEVPAFTDMIANFSVVDRDGQKIVFLPMSESYTVNITAKSDCEMSYAIQEFDSSNQLQSLINYTPIQMQESETAIGALGGGIEPAYSLVSSEESISSEVYPARQISPYSVEAIVEGNGHVFGATTKNRGEYVKLTARPLGESSFYGWYQNGKLISNEAEYRFCVSSDITLTAKFVPGIINPPDEVPEYEISVIVQGNGHVLGASKKKQGEFIQLTAIPTEDGSFIGWYENGVKIADATESYRFMVTTDRTLEARFVPITSATTFTITAAGSGGSVSGSGTYNANATVTLISAPNPGFSFDGWYENGSKLVGGSSTYSFTATTDRTLEARFSPIGGKSYIITATTGAGGKISPADSVVVEEGGKQAFTITADSGYHIQSVKVDGANIGAIGSYTFENTTTSHSIHAEFAKNTSSTNHGSGRNNRGSSNGDSSADRDSTYTVPTAMPQTKHIIDAANMNKLIATAKQKNQSFVLISSELPITVQAPAWKLLSSYKFISRTMSGKEVQVQLTFPDPVKVTSDMQVSGYVKGPIVSSRKAFFQKWYENKVQVVHLEHTGSFGQPVEIAAKVDLSGMDTKNLHFYSYDLKSNRYNQIANPNDWIDKNGYLHFTSEQAKDIIISEEELCKKTDFTRTETSVIENRVITTKIVEL